MSPNELIEAKIATIADRVKRLKGFADIAYSNFSESSDTKDIVERNLQVAIEACLDIGKIIISEMNLREPSDNKGVFNVLVENGIISDESLSFLIPMAGTRNVLVHGYDKIDDTIIFGILKKHLDDFSRFVGEINKNYLKNYL